LKNILAYIHKYFSFMDLLNSCGIVIRLTHPFGQLLAIVSNKHISHKPCSSCGSENGKFSYGYASSPGKRSYMEDFHETRVDGVDGETVGLFGVFDGKMQPILDEKFMTLRLLGVANVSKQVIFVQPDHNLFHSSNF
jgi:hypothetical protein